MAIHLSLEEDDSDIQALLPCLPMGQVCSTTVTLTPSGSRMPGNYLTVWLAHPRGIPCRHRRVLRVVDLTNEQHDDHDHTLLASESYDALRELHWSSYRFWIVPERPSWPPLARPYAFRLTSFECSAVLTGDIIVRILVCSSKSLQSLYLLIHRSQLRIIAPMLTETDTTLAALRSLTLLPADEAFHPSPVLRFLLYCPRLSHLAISAEYPKHAQLCAPHTPRLRSLTLYCAGHLLSLGDAQEMGNALQDWSGLRALTMHTYGLTGDDVRDELRRICTRARVALRLTIFRGPDLPWLDPLWPFFVSDADI